MRRFEALDKFLDEYAASHQPDQSPMWFAIDRKMFANPRDQPKWSIEKHPRNSYIWGGRPFHTFEEARRFVVDAIEQWAKGPYGPAKQMKRLDRPYAHVIDLQEGDRVGVELPDGSIWSGLLKTMNSLGVDVAQWQKEMLGDRRPPVPKPSTTPPMWANDASRSRRPKRQRGQQRRQDTR